MINCPYNYYQCEIMSHLFKTKQKEQIKEKRQLQNLETSAYYFLLIEFHQCLHVFLRPRHYLNRAHSKQIKDFPNTKFCTNLISAGYIHSPEHRDEYDRHSAANDEVGNDKYIVLYSVRVDLRWDTKQRDSREV